MRPFVPMKNLEWYENFIKEKIIEIRKLNRKESISSNESTSRYELNVIILNFQKLT